MRNLRVLHASKKQGLSAFTGVLGALHIDTCLRKLWIFVGDEVEGGFEGIEAYDFLLRVACGLESEIVGETDIFGQIKDAWSKGAGLSADQREKLAPWMQRLFEDTKEIRTRYVQNLGSVSYGSLVRKLLRESAKRTGRTEPVLLVGAGAFAESIAPWLLEQELWIVNRTVEKAHILKAELENGRPKNIAVLEGDDEIRTAWITAAHVIVCVPASHGPEIEWYLEGATRGPRTLMHLGAMAAECGEWANVPGFFALDTIFEMQKKQNEQRSIGIERARRACLDRAKLRALDGSVTTPHGWEDLAAF